VPRIVPLSMLWCVDIMLLFLNLLWLI
jgi:hypothetical protein